MRSKAAGGPHVYPFSVNESARLLEFTGTKGNWGLYLFMLFATRMNMRDHKVQGGIDGTALFEEICCEVAKNYWGRGPMGWCSAPRGGPAPTRSGHSRMRSMISASGFSEGVEYCSHSGFQPAAQDGNLDVVVWKHFTDGKHGKLVGFGQCKTGTHWKNGLFEMVPTGFCRKWVRTQPVVEPVRLYFMTSRLRHAEWYDCSVDGGILFDRCRILDYAPKMAHAERPLAGMDEGGHEKPEDTRNMRHRLHALCPYFAMFPESFAETWIDQLSKPGEIVLDPFSGRGTTAFQSMLMGRQADRLRCE